LDGFFLRLFLRTTLLRRPCAATQNPHSTAQSQRSNQNSGNNTHGSSRGNPGRSSPPHLFLSFCPGIDCVDSTPAYRFSHKSFSIFNRLAIPIIAILIKSAAVPCNGEFNAVRSAKFRNCT